MLAAIPNLTMKTLTAKKSPIPALLFFSKLIRDQAPSSRALLLRRSLQANAADLMTNSSSSSQKV
jgi:hypothetical protein